MAETVRRYVSEAGAEAFNDLRIYASVMPEGNPPIKMLGRLPSEECGCPEELWRIEGIDLLFHFEADGKSEAFVFAGDFEAETTLTARTLNDLRAKAFQWFADIIDMGEDTSDG